MSAIPPGRYKLTKPVNLYVTDISNGQILVLPETPGPQQAWIVTNLDNGNSTLRNVATGKFLGYTGSPEAGKLCEDTPNAVEWRIQASAAPGRFNVVVASDSVALAFASPFPPNTGLVELKPGDPEQFWVFVMQGN